MCGIAGFKGELFANIRCEVLENLALGLKSRGEHATGIGFYNSPDKPKVLKAPIAPSKVHWETLFGFSPCKSDTMIFHNRYATHGKPEINKNNHPFQGKGYLLAHNGVLSNYKDLLKQYELNISEKEPETDSYAVVKILDKIISNGKTLVESLKELCPKIIGSMVLTILTKENELILVRGSKYSFKLYEINDKNFIYASAANTAGSKEHIDIALEPLYLELIKKTPGNFSIKDIQIPEYSITTITAEGELKQDFFEKPKSTYAPSYNNVNLSTKTSHMNSPYRYYNNSGYNYRQTSLFDTEDSHSSFEGILSTRHGQMYINDVMDELEDVWERWYLTKFDYPTIREMVSEQVSDFNNVDEIRSTFSSPKNFANMMLESGIFEELE